MNSETLVVERLPPSSNQIYTEQRADLMKRDFSERPPNRRENANNHLPISYFSPTSPESISVGDRVARSKLPEPRTIAPNIPTVHCHYTNSEGSGTKEDHPRSSESRLSTSQNPLQNVAASSIDQSSQLLPPDYADPKRVPGTDQNIYPYAPINPEFHERYPQLVDFFKQAVDTHKFLKHHTSKINYELRLCGSNLSNAVASIIVFCTEAIFKHLRSLLNSRHIRRQYQLEKPFVLSKFPFPPSKPHLQASALAIVPFKVVFWREVTTPTKRRSTKEQVVAQSQSFLTMCGSLVRYGDRTSTLGLLISVDSKLYGLTVDHLFTNQRDEKQSMITKEPNILSDENDTEGNQADRPWVDDVTYEDLDDDQGVSDNGSVTPGRSHTEVTMGHAFINGHKVDPVHERDTSTPYLDWALIKFDGGYFERPNAFYSEDDSEVPKFLARISIAPQTSRVHVFMISGVSGTRKGVMLNSNSYIGGKPGENLCQAWNVILSDSARVVDGDCGSLIVNQKTLEVYGHVVASNPLGEAYVVPLQNTFHQISDALEAKDLSLPSPRLLLANLITHYSEAVNTDVADEAKLILASMEVLSGIDNRSDIGGQVRNDPTASMERNLKVIEELERSEPTLRLAKPRNEPTALPHERYPSNFPSDDSSLGWAGKDLVSPDLEERSDPMSIQAAQINAQEGEHGLKRKRLAGELTSQGKHETPSFLALDHENDIACDTDIRHPALNGGNLPALVEQLTCYSRNSVNRTWPRGTKRIMSGVRCTTCASRGQEVWVIPGRACGYCGTGC